MPIQPCSTEHAERYGEIYAAAFSAPPWNDPWQKEAAVAHVAELLASPKFYGLECVADGQIAGFLLGETMLFHYGETFEIRDLAVDPAFRRRGIATRLLERCLADLAARGIAGVHLITAADGPLPAFYGKFGFKRESKVLLMGMDLPPRNAPHSLPRSNGPAK